MSYTGSNPMAAAAFEMLEQLIGTWTDNAAKLAAAKGDRDAALLAWSKSSDNPRAVELREVITKARAEMRQLAEENVPNVTLDESDVSKLNTVQETTKTQIRAGFAQAAKILDFMPMDAEGVKTYLAGLTDPTKGTRKASAGGTGHSGPRASAYVWVTHETNGPVAPGKGTHDDKHTDAFKSFSWAAKAVSVSTEDLVKAYAEAAGVEYDKVADIDTAQEFEFTAKGGQAKWTIRTEPKPRTK